MSKTTNIIGFKDGIPIILCELKYRRRRDPLTGLKVKLPEYRFWCDYCHVYHRHGAKPGHRVAHCSVANSPFKVKGYILTVEEDIE